MKKDIEGEGNKITREEVEQSIHGAIPNMLDDERVKEAISEIINEGGWIEILELVRKQELEKLQLIDKIKTRHHL